jgi:endonuclease/exonuclease/phosphatase family metal-dependent hydrolase
MTRRAPLACLVLLSLAGAASAQWDPQNGLWGKSEASDVRVMTWNILDAIRTENPNKADVISNWNACVRIVAGLQPDILILQETGDNGCSGCVDSVAELETLCTLFFEGGTDPFLGGPVTSYVQLFAPGYNLPFKFVSLVSDGFNRNIVLSRFPYADLNGDGAATESNFLVVQDAYTSTGNVIRGYQFAEIDLPDGVYAGDLVVGNGHLKAGGASGDLSQRLEEGKRIAYLIDYMFNGAGTGVPDPNGLVVFPNPTTILPADTPVIWGGDWNEDEQTNGRKGPAEWMTRAEFTGGTDGTDRNRGDSVFDSATDVFSGARGTRGGSKLDYLAWQDSIVEGVTRQFVFESSSVSSINQLPAPVRTFPYPAPQVTSSFASDHRPVVVDFRLPLATGGPCSAADVAEPFGILDLADINAFASGFLTQNPVADLAPPTGVFDLADINAFVNAFVSGCP